MPHTIQFYAKELFTQTLVGKIKQTKEIKVHLAPSELIFPSPYRHRSFDLELLDGSTGALHLWTTLMGETPKVAMMHYQGPVPDYVNPRTHTPNVNLLAVGYPINQWDGLMQEWLGSSVTPNNTPAKPIWRLDSHRTLGLGRKEEFAPDALYSIIRESSPRMFADYMERFKGH